MEASSGTASERPRNHTSVPAVLTASAVTCLFWLIFIGSLAVHELEVGAAAVVLTIAFAVFARNRSSSHITLHARDVFQAWRVPGYILTDIWTMTVVLFRDLLGLRRAESLFRVASFASPGEDAEHLGRRILATAYTTATPSIIVIGIDVDRRRMLFHQIQRADLPTMTKALGAHS